jgi:hypothetical protein
MPKLGAQLRLNHSRDAGRNSAVPRRSRWMGCAGNTVVARHSSLAGTVGFFPAREVGENRLGVGAYLGLGVAQLCDHARHGIMKFRHVSAIIAVVLDHKSRAYPYER